MGIRFNRCWCWSGVFFLLLRSVLIFILAPIPPTEAQLALDQWDPVWAVASAARRPAPLLQNASVRSSEIQEMQIVAFLLRSLPCPLVLLDERRPLSNRARIVCSSSRQKAVLTMCLYCLDSVNVSRSTGHTIHVLNTQSAAAF